jgi:dTDP-4-dehydrorhamnose reductase
MILILGHKGMLGGQLIKVFGSEAIGWDRGDIDATKFDDLRLKILDLKPTVIINCIAFNDVDGAEEKPEIAFKLNAELVKELSSIANACNSVLVHYSTNYVFDGEKGQYTETDIPNPQSVYAKSKYQGEQEIISAAKKYYLIRTAVLFGEKGESEVSKKSFVDLMLELSATRNELKVVTDEINSITYVFDLAWATKVLLSQQFAFGIYHFTNLGQASWYDFAKEIFTIKNKNINLTPVSSSEFPRKAKRPTKSVLLNTKFIAFRPWQEALKGFLVGNL